MSKANDLIRARFGIDAGLSDDEPVHPTLAGILARRTIRRYSDAPVSDALLATLLACAQSAPAKSDLQQYAIIHVTRPEAKARLAELANTAWIASAPVVLVFCGDTRRARRICALRGKPYVQNTLDSFMNAAADAALALQSFIVAAEAAGLGCCPISQVRNHIDETAALLGLPDGVFPLAGLTAGWPAEARAVTLRLPPSVVVHTDRYADDDLAAEIDAYDARRHAAFPIPPRSQLHNDVYGEAAFYGWSENVARRLSRPEGRETLRAFLEAHGFDLA